MRGKLFQSRGMCRREFLAATTAAIGSAVIPNAAAAPTAAKWRRVNISDPSTPKPVLDRVLASYKKAIRAMLALPPDDPRNWYRNALVHTLDCPHGNWWFMPWHRGYLGWFEKTCRELSGDTEFALPYWDWTMEPRVPLAMFEDVLDPNNDAFIGKHDDFKSKFKDVVRKADYWDLKPDGSPCDQYAQLLSRGIRFPDDLWFDIIENPVPLSQYFFDRPHARGLTKDHPDLAAGDDPTKPPRCKPAVDLGRLIDALGPRDFVTFASPKTAVGHNVTFGFGVLEGLPHNQVHNCVGGGYNGKGGFMLNFLSPVDPIFFLHHANIDRLWDVWTRKQEARNNPNLYPTLPDGYLLQPDSDEEKKSDYHRWRIEPFLFFVNEKGRPAPKTKAGDYAKIGEFDYDYQPGGSGEEVVPAPPVAAAPAIGKIRRFSAEMINPSLSATRGANATVATIPPELLQAGAEPGAPKLFAKITVAFPPLGHVPLDVLINAPAGSENLDTSSPFFAGALAMFGTHILHGPVTFTVPLSASVEKLRSSKQLVAGAPLDIRVVPSAMPHAAMARGAAAEAELVSIVVEAH